MKVGVGARTDVGLLREGNEDAYLAEDVLFAVADGMGGHLAGDVASSITVDALRERAAEEPPADPDALAGLLYRANTAIFERARHDPSLHGMGTTCTALMIGAEEAHIAHVGDSRAYLLRNGSLSQLTQDHTLVNRMVQEGKLRSEDAERHPQRSVLTRALGVDPEVKIDTQSLDTKEGDRLLLCSDGLTSMVDTDSIAEALRSEKDPQSAADHLVEIAIAAGGEDNVTVVVLDLTTEGVVVPREDTEVGAGIPIARSGDFSGSESGFQQPGVGIPQGRTRASTSEAVPSHKRERTLLLSALVLLVLVALAYAGTRFALSNSYFVGVNDDRRITIFSGIPERILGIAFREPKDQSYVTLSDLPPFKQEDVREGIRVDSLADAHALVDSLEELASDPELKPNRRRS